MSRTFVKARNFARLSFQRDESRAPRVPTRVVPAPIYGAMFQKFPLMVSSESTPHDPW